MTSPTTTETVPCTYCDAPTIANTGSTGICDACWEIIARLPGFLVHPKAREWVRCTLEGADAYISAYGGPYISKEEHP